MAVFSAPALRYSDARGDEAPSMRKKSCFLGQRTPPGIWGRVIRKGGPQLLLQLRAVLLSVNRNR